MVVNTKQKIAVLAAGLVVATTGLVTDQAAAADQPAPVVVTHADVRTAEAGKQRAGDLAARLGQSSREIGEEP